MAMTLKPRAAVKEEIDDWDDGDLDIGGDDFTFRSVSAATTATNGPSHHRDSIASRMSFRSDFDSNHGDDEKQLHLPGDDERSTQDAIQAATKAGIPIPQNVPSSALMGGTIKRLGGRKIKKIVQDDWDDDLELPAAGTNLKIKKQDESNFPDMIRQVSGPSAMQPSSVTAIQPAPVFRLSPQTTLRPAAANPGLARYQDDDDDDDFFGNPQTTIKVVKNRNREPTTLVLPPTPQKTVGLDDDFESDLQLPSGKEPLRLSARKEIPKTPIGANEDLDDWGEGSLGTRFGGTRRDRQFPRSSSAAALSPSVSSSLTMESEDEGLDGLVLPQGPIRFEEILKKRQESQSPEHEPVIKQTKSRPSIKDDFLSGLEIGDGDVFNSNKSTLNRHIKVKNVRQTSPQRPKAAVSLVFTNKPSPPTTSRLPRPLGSHDRLPSSLAPVSESGGPIATRSRRSQSRLGGHSSQSSITHIPVQSTPSSAHQAPPSTPRRREIAQKPSITALRNEPTTTSSQLLKVKRSMPAIRNTQSPAKAAVARYERPPSRAEGGMRPVLTMARPKTPVERDRSGAESSMSHARKNPLPFLPAGASQAQSQHVTSKSSRHFRRNDSDASNNSGEHRPPSRAMSRATLRSPSPARSRTRGAEALAREAAAKRQITKPVRRRHFGDGCELDGFDDLPTSHLTEQRYTKQPIARGAPKALLRNKVIQNNPPDRTYTPAPSTPSTPSKPEALPRFARDTNASRLAREQALSQRAPSSGAPLAALTNQWKAQVNARTGLNPVNPQIPRLRKSKQTIPQKPHLIKPMGDVGKTSTSIKGMIYNPLTFRWEGNENELQPFDADPTSPVSTIPPHVYREKENSTPRPALITNINASKGVQVVGGMVFDPQKMCWLKVPATQSRDRPQTGRSEASTGDTMDGFDALDDDEEEDVFKDVPDLEDKPKDSAGALAGARASTGSEKGGLKDDWLVGEEFDVGPEFIRRQREEEERWRRKCEKWIGVHRDRAENDDWRWRIRDVVSEL